MADSTYESPASLRPTKFGSGDFVKDRPAINAGMRDLHLQAGKALRLLEQTNHPPELFCQGSSIVRMVGDDSGFPVLQVLDESRMRQTLAERLAWNKRDQHGKHPARPPWDLPKNILAIPHKSIAVSDREKGYTETCFHRRWVDSDSRLRLRDRNLLPALETFQTSSRFRPTKPKGTWACETVDPNRTTR